MNTLYFTLVPQELSFHDAQMMALATNSRLATKAELIRLFKNHNLKTLTPNWTHAGYWTSRSYKHQAQSVMTIEGYEKPDGSIVRDFEVLSQPKKCKLQVVLVRDKLAFAA